MIFSDLPSPAEAGFAKAGNRSPSPITSRTSFSGSCATVDLASKSVYVAARNLVFGLILLTRSLHVGLLFK
jgi:hypothetical protein